jgi:type VI secretion system protein ImpA
VSFRDFESVFAGNAEAPVTEEQLGAAIRDAQASGAGEQLAAVNEAYESLQTLRRLLDEKTDVEDRPDLERLEETLKVVSRGIRRLSVSAVDGSAAQDAGAPGGAEADGPAFVAGAIRSRDDARRALERVCEYLEQHEPSNPAALFARRAQRMLNMPFLDIMRELAPDAVAHVEMVTGAPRSEQS